MRKQIGLDMPPIIAGTQLTLPATGNKLWFRCIAPMLRPDLDRAGKTSLQGSIGRPGSGCHVVHRTINREP